MDTFNYTPVLFGLMAAFVTSLGLLAVAFRSEWSTRYAGLFGLGAAGMLLIMVFLHILPEAFATSSAAPLWLAAGFFGGLIIHFSVRALFPEKLLEQGLPRDAITPVLAIAVHSFIDGIVYAMTFAASFSSGVYAALGLILHEFPEGVIAFAILRSHGASTRAAFLWAFLAAAATTPLGAAISVPLMQTLGPDTLGIMLSVSAGLILFVASGPLMAPLRDTPPARGLTAVSAGILIGLLVLTMPLPGGHGHHNHHDHNHQFTHIESLLPDTYERQPAPQKPRD